MEETKREKKSHQKRCKKILCQHFAKPQKNFEQIQSWREIRRETGDDDNNDDDRAHKNLFSWDDVHFTLCSNVNSQNYQIFAFQKSCCSSWRPFTWHWVWPGMQWEHTKSQGLQSSRKQILITTLNYIWHNYSRICRRRNDIWKCTLFAKKWRIIFKVKLIFQLKTFIVCQEVLQEVSRHA